MKETNTLASLKSWPEQAIESVRARLRELLDAVKKNSGKFAGAVFGVLTLSGNAHAQDMIALNAANTPTPSISTPSTILNPVWEKEFKAWVTKEQRGAWSEEKKEAWRNWKERDNSNLALANQEKQAKDGALVVANQKLDESIAGRAVANQKLWDVAAAMTRLTK